MTTEWQRNFRQAMELPMTKEKRPNLLNACHALFYAIVPLLKTRRIKGLQIMSNILVFVGLGLQDNVIDYMNQVYGDPLYFEMYLVLGQLTDPKPIAHEILKHLMQDDLIIQVIQQLIHEKLFESACYCMCNASKSTILLMKQDFNQLTKSLSQQELLSFLECFQWHLNIREMEYFVLDLLKRLEHKPLDLMLKFCQWESVSSLYLDSFVPSFGLHLKMLFHRNRSLRILGAQAIEPLLTGTGIQDLFEMRVNGDFLDTIRHTRLTLDQIISLLSGSADAYTMQQVASNIDKTGLDLQVFDLLEQQLPLSNGLTLLYTLYCLRCLVERKIYRSSQQLVIQILNQTLKSNHTPEYERIRSEAHRLVFLIAFERELVDLKLPHLMLDQFYSGGNVTRHLFTPTAEHMDQLYQVFDQLVKSCRLDPKIEIASQNALDLLLHAKNHDQVHEALSVLEELSCLDYTFQSLDRIDYLTPLSRHLMTRILRFLKTPRLEQLHSHVLKALHTVFVPILEIASIEMNAGNNAYNELSGEILSFFKFLFHNHSHTSFVTPSFFEVLRLYIHCIFASEQELAKNHKRRIDCLMALLPFSCTVDLTKKCRHESIVGMTNVLVQVIGYSQHNYGTIGQGDVFTFKDRSVYRLASVCLRNFSRIMLQETSAIISFGEHWLFENDLEWVLRLVNDDETIVQTLGLGILGNLILYPGVYPYLLEKAPQFVDMAISILGNLNEPTEKRQEACLLINNFIVSLSSSQPHLSEPIHILETCGFFTCLDEIISTSFLGLFEALTELLLNLTIAHKEFMIPQLFKSIQLLIGFRYHFQHEFDPSVQRLAIKQFHQINDPLIERAICNVLQMVKLMTIGSDEALGFIVKASNILQLLSFSIERESQSTFRILGHVLVDVLSYLSREESRIFLNPHLSSLLRMITQALDTDRHISLHLLSKIVEISADAVLKDHRLEEKMTAFYLDGNHQTRLLTKSILQAMFPLQMHGFGLLCLKRVESCLDTTKQDRYLTISMHLSLLKHYFCHDKSLLKKLLPLAQRLLTKDSPDFVLQELLHCLRNLCTKHNDNKLLLLRHKSLGSLDLCLKHELLLGSLTDLLKILVLHPESHLYLQKVYLLILVSFVAPSGQVL
ncbi:hypothetical protein EDD86DRAFT_261089 [Gorgonomyces haynaldii]|nr:hypothetical protein EDD86DRAFT_261089 [Gorgonomyces haynaldii]